MVYSENIPEIQNLKPEEIIDLARMGNPISLSGLIKITMKAQGCISRDDVIKFIKFVQPDFGMTLIIQIIDNFVLVCKRKDSFLEYNSNQFCIPEDE